MKYLKRELNEVLFIATPLGFCFLENLNIFAYAHRFFLINASDMRMEVSMEIRKMP